MATILRLVGRSNHDTVLVLQALLAEATNGDASDLALCFRDRHGVERWVFTGVYQIHPAEAVNAAARMTWRLSEQQEAS